MDIYGRGGFVGEMLGPGASPQPPAQLLSVLPQRGFGTGYLP